MRWQRMASGWPEEQDSGMAGRGSQAGDRRQGIAGWERGSVDRVANRVLDEVSGIPCTLFPHALSRSCGLSEARSPTD